MVIDKEQLDQLNAYARSHAGELRVTVQCDVFWLSINVVTHVGKGNLYRNKSTPLTDVPDIAAAKQIIDHAIRAMRSGN
jgi:hypothetical protein